jgi:hypothetical protein
MTVVKEGETIEILYSTFGQSRIVEVIFKYGNTLLYLRTVQITRPLHLCGAITPSSSSSPAESGIALLALRCLFMVV